MNKILAFITLAAVAVSFNSCKKGEEDPFLTFKSRDSRIQGEWLVDEVTIEKSTTEINTAPFGGKNSVVTTKTYVINNDGKGTLTKIVLENGSEVSNKVTDLTTATVGLTINEDGSYATNDMVSYKTNGEQLTEGNTVTGQWAWGSGVKNKSSINFVTTELTKGDGDFSHALILGEFYIIGLNPDELKLEQNYNSYNIDGSDVGSTYEIEETSTITATFRK